MKPESSTDINVRTLGQIRLDKSKSVDPTKHPEEEFELYSIPAYEKGKPEILKGSEVGSSKKSLEPGCVVLSKINPRINRVWIVGNYSSNRKIGSGEWIPFFPVPDVLPEYLAYFLRQHSFRNFLASNASGVGGSLMRVKPSTFYSYPIPVPGLDIQKRIVDSIESYHSRLDNAVASLKSVQAKLKQYRASVLKAAVEGRLVPTEAELARKEGRDYEPASVLLERILKERKRRWIEDAAEKGRAKDEERTKKAGKAWTAEDDATALESERGKAAKKYKEPLAPDTEGLPELPEGWCWVTIDQLIYGIDAGFNFRCIERPPKGTEAGLVKVSAVSWGEFDPTQTKTIPEDRSVSQRSRIATGNFLISRANTIDLVGACVVVRTEPQNLFLSDKILRLNTLGAIEEWLLICLRTRAGRAQIQSLATGNQESMRNISQTNIRRITVPMPPETERDRLLNQSQRQFTSADSESTIVSNSIRRLRTLRQSILGAAFSGRLTT